MATKDAQRMHHELATTGKVTGATTTKPSARFYAKGGFVRTKNMEHVRHMGGMKGFAKTRGKS